MRKRSSGSSFHGLSVCVGVEVRWKPLIFSIISYFGVKGADANRQKKPEWLNHSGMKTE